ncbi:unnamed protein product [Thelazia callipaeda]|uniref:P4Hc domain-containing protein n=1 Tax=Thelazia callipaeda TaxID=103827 RepID=A0A0N5D426_THECL|nr:unnamed protein product [Thelazia callipaeda]
MSEDNSTSVLINPVYQNPHYAALFKETLLGQSQFSDPFPYFSLPNFLTNQQFVTNLRQELEQVQYNRRENDLFSLYQTDDLKNFDRDKFPLLTRFRELFCTDVLQWLRNISSVNLTDDVAITSSKYCYTDLLLPHDDRCEKRKFAFIFYLTPNWKETDGGQLVLFNSNDKSNPTSVGRIVTPAENMLTIFEVSPRSWHMVTEVRCQQERLSLHGWFHHDVNDDASHFNLDHIEKLVKPHLDITYNEVLEWINEDYIAPNQQQDIRSFFKSNSEISLAGFISENKLGSLLHELDNADFKIVGPVNKKKLEILQETVLPKDSSLSCLLRLMQSQAMALLISQWTGLPLYPIENEVTTEQGIRCNTLVYRICEGYYTMVDDQVIDEMEQLGYGLNFKLILCANEWNEEHGGFISYIAKELEDEVTRFVPANNHAALVLIEPGIYPFIKYVNCKAKQKCYYMIDCYFYGFRLPDDFVTSSEESLESGIEYEDGSENEGGNNRPGPNN